MIYRIAMVLFLPLVALSSESKFERLLQKAGTKASEKGRIQLLQKLRNLQSLSEDLKKELDLLIKEIKPFNESPSRGDCRYQAAGRLLPGPA